MYQFFAIKMTHIYFPRFRTSVNEIKTQKLSENVLTTEQANSREESVRHSKWKRPHWWHL